MSCFRVLVATAAFLMLGACEKVEPQAKDSSPVPQVASTPVPPVPAKPAPKTYEGPFGLAMGIQIKELVDDLGFKHVVDTLYSGTPPKPAPGFDEYLVSATPSGGICKVIATKDVKNVSGSGNQLKAATDEIAEMVELKYGKSTKKFDFASQDVYRRNPEFWMMALMKGEVTYLYSWTKGKALDLPNDIVDIEVVAKSSSINDGFVKLLYSFSNNKACDDEIKRKKSTNL